LIRQDPKIWSTSNGDFQTKGKGSLRVKFCNYSNSKEVFSTPDIVEYDGTSNKPAFDLIIGAQTMTELGIILDFKEQMITIDEIKLPMRSINDLPSSNKEVSSYQNCMKNNEPKATEIATHGSIKRKMVHTTFWKPFFMTSIFMKLKPQLQGISYPKGFVSSFIARLHLN
jgi:hypothetical protein